MDVPAIFIEQGIHQTSFTHFTFTDEDELGFVEGDLRFGFGAQVSFDGVKTLFVCFGEFGVEGVVEESQIF